MMATFPWTRLVASQVPPMPTSTTWASTSSSANQTKARAVSAS